MFVVRSVSQTAAGGIISSREFLDLISNFKDNEKGIFISCGELIILFKALSNKILFL